MLSINFLVLTTLLSCFLPNVLSAPAPAPAIEGSGSVCDSGLYKVLMVLANYPPAEEFCASHHTTHWVTNTCTVTHAKKKSARNPDVDDRHLEKRTAGALPYFFERGVTIVVTTTTTTPVVVTTTSATPVAKCTGACATWKSIESVAGAILTTFCSCISPPATMTTTITTTTIT